MQGISLGSFRLILACYLNEYRGGLEAIRLGQCVSWS